jgi:hypothetical protein
LPAKPGFNRRQRIPLTCDKPVFARYHWACSGLASIVQEGDCISSIAVERGFFWQTIWDANPDLKKLRQNPNILFPDDIVHIPVLEPKNQS